jgi:hypothetical protein
MRFRVVTTFPISITLLAQWKTASVCTLSAPPTLPVDLRVIRTDTIRKKRSRAHAGLRVWHGMRGAAVDCMGGVGTRAVKATGVRTLPTAGSRTPRCRHSKSAHMDGVWNPRSGRSQSQHVTSTHECQIYIVQQNQIPIHRKTTERPAAVKNHKKHRPQTQKPSNPLASAPHAAPAAATS